MGLVKIIAFAFLSVAVAGGGTYLVMNNKASVETHEEAEVQEEAAEMENGAGSLRALLGLGQNLVCTFHSVIEGTDGTTAGTVYVSGGKMSGDFTITQNDMTFDSHVIIDQEAMYSWTMTEQGTFAYTFNLDDMNGDTSVSSNGQNAVSIDSPVEYECSPWNVDDSKFNLPSGIDFKDTSELMNMQGGASIDASAGAGISGSASQCAACEQIPNADAKAQCLAALSCN